MSHTQDPSSPEKKFPFVSWEKEILFVDAKKVHGAQIPTIWDVHTPAAIRAAVEAAFWAGLKYGRHGTVS
jgi:hypothetical protein